MVAGTTVHNKCKGSAQGNADQAFIRMKVEIKFFLGVQLLVASSVFFYQSQSQDWGLAAQETLEAGARA